MSSVICIRLSGVVSDQVCTTIHFSESAFHCPCSTPREGSGRKGKGKGKVLLLQLTNLQIPLSCAVKRSKHCLCQARGGYRRAGSDTSSLFSWALWLWAAPSVTWTVPLVQFSCSGRWAGALGWVAKGCPCAYSHILLGSLGSLCPSRAELFKSILDISVA